MDIAEISKRTGVPRRDLRYIVDNKILDRRRYTGGDKLNPGRGVPRYFSDFGGFSIALASLLRRAGLSRDRVGRAMDSVYQWATSHMVMRSRPTLEAFLIFQLAGSITLELGDAAALRITVERVGRSSVPEPESMEWRNIETGSSLPKCYVPLLRTEIDVGELARRLAS